MAPPASPRTEELPVIWLLPPGALLPSHHPIPILPIPIAISATLTILVFLVLIILYNKKPKVTTSRHKDIELTNLKDRIRVIRPESTATLATASPLSRHERSPTLSRSKATHLENGGSTISEPRVMTYHDALKDIRDASYRPTPDSPSSPSIGSYYYSPNATTDGECKYDAQAEHRIDLPTSSNYSISVGPTPLPSRESSLRSREVDGAWARLRLGSEYDGDRSFVPSEPNLQLRERKWKVRWN